MTNTKDQKVVICPLCGNGCSGGLETKQSPRKKWVLAVVHKDRDWLTLFECHTVMGMRMRLCEFERKEQRND